MFECFYYYIVMMKSLFKPRMIIVQPLTPPLGANLGIFRELQAVVSMYLGTIILGMSSGFSAVAIPDILAAGGVGGDNTTADNVTSLSQNHWYHIPPVRATLEELSWFGESLHTR